MTDDAEIKPCPVPSCRGACRETFRRVAWGDACCIECEACGYGIAGPDHDFVRARHNSIAREAEWRRVDDPMTPLSGLCWVFFIEEGIKVTALAWRQIGYLEGKFGRRWELALGANTVLEDSEIERWKEATPPTPPEAE